MNKWIGIGRLTNKPELRYTGNNVAYSRFSIAINRPKKEDGTQEADFIDCVVWKGQAENLCKYQEKGSLISVEGTLRKESYEDKDGNKRYNTEVLVGNIEYLQSKGESKKEPVIETKPEVEKDPFAELGEQVSIDDNFLD